MTTRRSISESIQLKQCEGIILKKMAEILVSAPINYFEVAKHEIINDGIIGVSSDDDNDNIYAEVSPLKTSMLSFDIINKYNSKWNAFTYPVITRKWDDMGNINIVKHYNNFTPNDLLFIWKTYTSDSSNHLTAVIYSKKIFYGFGFLTTDHVSATQSGRNFLAYILKRFVDTTVEDGVISTPDSIFELKVTSHFLANDPSKTFIKLIAAVHLNEKHIAKIKETFDSIPPEKIVPCIQTGTARKSMFIKEPAIPFNINHIRQLILAKMEEHEYNYNQSPIISDAEETEYKQNQLILSKILKNSYTLDAMYKDNLEKGLVKIRTMSYNLYTGEDSQYCVISSRGSRTKNCASWIENLFSDVVVCSYFGGAGILSSPQMCKQITPDVVLCAFGD